MSLTRLYREVIDISVELSLENKKTHEYLAKILITDKLKS